MKGLRPGILDETPVRGRSAPARAPGGLAWRDNRERLQAIFDAAPALIFVLDAHNRFVFVNRAWERAFDLTQAEIAGCSIFDLFPEPTARAMAEQNRRVLESCEPLERESVVRVGDRDRTFHTTKVALLDEGERPAGICGLSVDITERKRGESRLRLVSEIASALVVRGDDVDAFMEEMCRSLLAELRGDVYFHFRPDPTARRLRLASCGGIAAAQARDCEWLDYGAAVCGTVAATQRTWVIADVQASVDERTRLLRELGLVAFAAFPLLCNGTLYGTMSLGRRRGGSFTEEDCELMQTVADLAAVALDRAARARALVAVDRNRKEFLAVLAHELRGPLAPIVAALPLLRGAPHDAGRVTQAREVIERQAHSLSRLVEELLDEARVSHGKITLEARAVAVDEIVTRGVETCRPAIDARGHALRVSQPDYPVYVRGDRGRLTQVVANLLANSAKYTPRGGHIALEVAADDASVTIRVRDDGIGIEPDILPRVFNLFEQASIARRVAQDGLGIGLSLVRALVALHGGSIEAHSAGAGKGSEFTVRLPRLEDAHRPQARP